VQRKERPFTVDYQGQIFTYNLDICKLAQDAFTSSLEETIHDDSIKAFL
jgi:hypothetical protein